MVARRILPILVVICFGLAVPVQARKTYDPYEKQIKQQKEDNKRWEKNAKDEESRLMKIADAYYKQKEYDKAEEYYRQVLDIRYDQWNLREFEVGGKTVLRPALDKGVESLDTGNTRRARDRLRTMDEKIASQNEGEAKKRFSRLFEEAEVEMMLKNPTEAYQIYDRIIDLAGKLGKRKYAIDASLKAKGQQKVILDQAAKSLEEVEKLLKAGKIAEADEKLEEFESGQRTLLKTSRKLLLRVRQLRRSPEFLLHAREESADLRLRLGDSSLERGKYLSAYRHYKAVALKYPATKAAEDANKRIAMLLADPKIQQVMADQEIQGKCTPLLMRARALIRLNRAKEARAICETVIAEYPKTTWAAQAAELLKAVKPAAQKPPDKPMEKPVEETQTAE